MGDCKGLLLPYKQGARVISSVGLEHLPYKEGVDSSNLPSPTQSRD